MLLQASIETTADLVARAVRSPKTPQQANFTLDATAFPTPGRTTPTQRKVSPSIILTGEDNTASTPKIDQTPKQRRPITPVTSPGEKMHLLTGSPHDSPNVPSVPRRNRAIPTSLPRPLLRLFVLSTLMACSFILLICVPSAKLPSLRSAATAKRLALAPDGRAYYEAMNPSRSWMEASERDYVPPQIKAHHMMKRGLGYSSDVRADKTYTVSSLPERVSPKPLAPTHEFLALQSYILQGGNNVLPDSINPSKPLDANIILGFESDDAGALKELEKERLDDVVVWYGGDGTTRLPSDHLSMLAALHGEERRPTLLSVNGRPDLPVLLKVLNRLEISLERQPLIVIGNTPFVADLDKMEEMRGSGQLEEMLSKIGWVESSNSSETETTGSRGSRKKGEWKPKLAKWQKKEVTEVEHALKAAKRR